MDKEEALKQLGSAIRKRRLEIGITQNELALRTNKNQQSIYRLETGGINPTYYQLLEISKGLEISLTDFIKTIET